MKSFNTIAWIGIIFFLLISGCTYNNVDELKLRNWSYINTSNSALQSDIISGLKLDSKGNIWVNNYTDFISKISPDLHITKFDVPFNDSFPAPRYIQELAIDKLDRVWVGSRRGPLFFLENNIWKKVYCNGFDPNVLSIDFDENNNLWFGTGPDGLFKMEADSFINWGFFNSNIAGAEILNIAVKNSQEIYFRTEISPPWIGTKTSLSYFDGNSFSVLIENSNDSLGLLYRGIKFCLKNKNTLAIFGKYGIYEYHNGQFKKFGNDTLYNLYLQKGPLVNDIIYDNITGYWLATRDGLYNFQINKTQYYNMNNSGLNSNEIISLVFNKNHDLYIATTKKGICIYHLNN
jgi:ligand-binding sensor domain-containing protein